MWVATLSDKRVRIAAEFSESCVSAFEARGKPLKALRGGVFQLKNYKFVLRGHDTARFDGGVTLQQPLGDQNAGISIPEKSLASALTSSVRIIIDDMVFLSGEGNPEFGEPRAVGQFKELQQLLRQLPVKKSLLPGLKSRTSANATSNRRRSVMVEHDGESSSQPFATQAHTMMHFSDSDDGCESIASQLFDDGDSTLQFATQAHQQPRSKAHKSSSSKVGGQPETATLDPNASDVASVTGVHNRTKAIHDYSDLEFSGTMSSAPIRAAQNHGAGEGLSMNAPPSSPPAPPQMHDQSSRSKKKVLLEPQIAKPLLPLHPGWEGMTEVTARMAKIPQGQRKKLEKSGCTFSPNVCIHILYLPNSKYIIREKERANADLTTFRLVAKHRSKARLGLRQTSKCTVSP